MHTKANLGQHPIHPMLVSFPVVFYTLTVVGFLIYQFGNGSEFWYRLAYFSNFAGVATAIVAAIPGTIDWAFGIPKDSAAKSRGLIHMGLNVAALLLFTWSALLIYGTWNAPLADVMTPSVITVFGFLLTAAAGHHGWSLVQKHKIGVDLSPDQHFEPTVSSERGRANLSQPRTI